MCPADHQSPEGLRESTGAFSPFFFKSRAVLKFATVRACPVDPMPRHACLGGDGHTCAAVLSLCVCVWCARCLPICMCSEGSTPESQTPADQPPGGGGRLTSSTSKGEGAREEEGAGTHRDKHIRSKETKTRKTKHKKIKEKNIEEKSIQECSRAKQGLFVVSLGTQ